MDALAADCGVEVGSADQALKSALKKLFGSSDSDQKIVKLLPAAFAITLFSSQCREAQYIANLEGKILQKLVPHYCSVPKQFPLPH